MSDRVLPAQLIKDRTSLNFEAWYNNIFKKTASSLKWIVTGTPCGGTGFIDKVFRSVGVKSGHERVFFGAAPFEHPYTVDVSWLVSNYLTDPLLAPYKVVHLLRHPISVIQSDLARTYGRVNIGLAHLTDGIDWYLKRHALIKDISPVIVHRVEAPSTELLTAMKIPYAGKVIFSDTKYNTKLRGNHHKVTLASFKDCTNLKSLLDFCEEYKYNPEGGLL